MNTYYKSLNNQDCIEYCQAVEAKHNFNDSTMSWANPIVLDDNGTPLFAIAISEKHPDPKNTLGEEIPGLSEISSEEIKAFMPDILI